MLQIVSAKTDLEIKCKRTVNFEHAKADFESDSDRKASMLDDYI